MTLLNLDFFTVGLAIAGNLILGSIVFFAKRKSATSKLFFWLTVTISCWSLANYASYQTTDPTTALFLVRLVMFFAVPIGMLFLLFAYTFPGDELRVGPKTFVPLLIYSLITMACTQTPIVFSGITLVPGGAPKPVIQPGIILFAIIPVLAILFGIFHLVQNATKARSSEKNQIGYLSLGVAIMFSLIIIFDFVLPSFLDNTKFIPFAAIFTLPFVLFTAYAIIKYHLLNLKIIATEALMFALVVGMLSETLLSNNFTTLIFRFGVFLLVLTVGILLIKNVRKEVEQREQLQKLSNELSDANVKLQALDKARAEFISIASHQLRTPPATVKWFLASILAGDYGKLEKETREVLEKTFRTNDSLISLIDDMLNVSRIERGKMEFLFEETDLQKLAEITFEQLQPMALEKSLELLYNPPAEPLAKVMADKEKLRQVMNNMIDNAIKYTKQGSILVELFQEDDNLRFQVTDSGKGITPEELNQIFQKYTRGKESIKQSAGLGLGLYVAKVIIEQHKGKIWAESQGSGKGSKFIFTIPIHNNLTKTTLFDLTIQEQTIVPPTK